MKRNRFLQAAAVLWALAVLGAGIMPGTALARYTALGRGFGAARVAKWDIFDSAKLKDKDKRALLVYGEDEARAAQVTQVTLTNDSDVTARYLLEWSVEEPPEDGDFDIAIETSAADLTEFGAYSDVDGIIVPYGKSVVLDITIPVATFRGLQIDAIALQID